MDWGVILSTIVFAVMVALMVVINSLDRKMTRRQEQHILIAEPEIEAAAANTCS